MRLELASEFASISDTKRSVKSRKPAQGLIFFKGEFQWANIPSHL